MEIRLQDRQTGKTFDLIKKLNESDNSAVILPNMTFAVNFARISGISKDRIFTISQVINGSMRGKRFDKVYIDEVGICLRHIVPNLIYGTHTNE